MLHVLLPTMGSAGDVHPFIALGVALQARGHRATILTNPLFQPVIEAQGLGFLAVGTVEEANAAIANPELWHLRKGFGVIAQVIVPAIAETYRLIEKHADSSTVVAFSSLALGARLAQEKLGVPSASVHLQPSIIRTYADQGMMGNVRLSASTPMWFKRGLFRLIDAAVLDRRLRDPLNSLRAKLGLRPVDRVMHRWVHSPQLVIAFFPEWFAAPQPDWPANTHAVGFPLWDTHGEAAPMAQAEEFLAAGAAPVIFTPGSAGATMERFFKESVAAASQLGLRAMLVTNYPEQIPSGLPAGIRTFGYVPFSRVLPRAALLVYHGGVGTLAQGIKASVPHLVVPHGYDQFDSGWRIEQLGLGRSIPERRYRAHRVAQAIEGILGDAAAPARRKDYAGRINSADAVARACGLIEGLAQGAMLR
ncbi:MAG TPA: nucleotide disphospho-sugar-binding domain-containing protein [Steroidobacteraceae bacterium]|jgi:rhamnosyltransferase subunit B|nr:nucleotide disphospho-sugar-binding domain-containing protein [Steroidobacteraceae bacterium]